MKIDDNPTLDLRPMEQITVSLTAMVMLGDDMAFEKILNCGRFMLDKPKLPEGCRCLTDLQTYQLQLICGRADFSRDLLIILARYLCQRQYAVENGQPNRFRTAEQLTESFIHSYGHHQLVTPPASSRAYKKSEDLNDNDGQLPQNPIQPKIVKRFTRGSLAYHLPDKILMGNPIHPSNPGPPRGQGLLIRDWILNRPDEEVLKPFTYQEVTDDLVRQGFTCNQSPYRAIGWVLDEWVKKGYLVKK